MDAEARLNQLCDIASCPVCFERLRPPSTCCVNGHAVCAKCGGELPQCPTCQGRFLEGKNTMLDQILEALPVPCKHKGCTEDTKDDPDHEKWCGFRDTRCRWGNTFFGWCEWTGPVSQLQQHVRQKHELFSSIDEYNNMCDGGVRLTADDWSGTDAVVEHGHVFWITWKRMGSNKPWSYHIVCVPNGRFRGDMFRFKVEFKSGKSSLDGSTSIQLGPDNDCDYVNSVIFHFDSLKPYAVDNMVRPKFYILKD